MIVFPLVTFLKSFWIFWLIKNKMRKFKMAENNLNFMTTCFLDLFHLRYLKYFQIRPEGPSQLTFKKTQSTKYNLWENWTTDLRAHKPKKITSKSHCNKWKTFSIAKIMTGKKIEHKNSYRIKVHHKLLSEKSPIIILIYKDTTQWKKVLPYQIYTYLH